MKKNKHSTAAVNAKATLKPNTTKLSVNTGKAVKNMKGDVNSKRIFENPYLCAQFLRDYSGLAAFANVQPKNIEVIKLRYHLFEDVELNSDSAIRILRILREDNFPVYIVPLIDHKSTVDFHVGMQLHFYMSCIWKEWEKEMTEKGYNYKAKSFQYPMIYPIVYYEGTEPWTADCHFSSLIRPEDFMKKYTPEFEYHVVKLHKYTDKELLDHSDEISLVMLLNKIQHSGDIERLRQIDFKNVDPIIANTPERVLGLIAGFAMSLCHKLNVPEDEANVYVEKIRKERRMGYFFENMEKMDIQAERRKTAEERQKNAELTRRAESAEANEKALLLENQKLKEQLAALLNN